MLASLCVRQGEGHERRAQGGRLDPVQGHGEGLRPAACDLHGGSLWQSMKRGTTAWLTSEYPLHLSQLIALFNAKSNPPASLPPRCFPASRRWATTPSS